MRFCTKSSLLLKFFIKSLLLLLLLKFFIKLLVLLLLLLSSSWFLVDLNKYGHNLRTISLWDVASYFLSVATFVVVDRQTISYNNVWPCL